MKLTKKQLKEMIKEEIKSLEEISWPWGKKQPEKEEEEDWKDKGYRAAGVGRIDYDDDDGESMADKLGKEREAAIKKEKEAAQHKQRMGVAKLQRYAREEKARHARLDKNWRKKQRAIKKHLYNKGLGIHRKSAELEKDIDSLKMRIKKQLNLDKSWAAVDIPDIDAWLKARDEGEFGTVSYDEEGNPIYKDKEGNITDASGNIIQKKRGFMQKAGSFLTGQGFKESKLRLKQDELNQIIKEELQAVTKGK